jgi:hypothetical protein
MQVGSHGHPEAVKIATIALANKNDADRLAVKACNEIYGAVLA